jgi:hypothetical protein
VTDFARARDVPVPCRPTATQLDGLPPVTRSGLMPL